MTSSKKECLVKTVKGQIDISQSLVIASIAKKMITKIVKFNSRFNEKSPSFDAIKALTCSAREANEKKRDFLMNSL